MVKNLVLLFLGLMAISSISDSAHASLKADKIIVMKSKHELFLLNSGQVIGKYGVSLGKNPKGPKRYEGDNKTPEGNYFIAAKNPNSQYHLALKVSYPSKEDLALAQQLGVSPGGDIMIHGSPNQSGWMEKFVYRFKDWTAGCIAVKDEDMNEIFSLVDAGTPIDIRP